MILYCSQVCLHRFLKNVFVFLKKTTPIPDFQITCKIFNNTHHWYKNFLFLWVLTAAEYVHKILFLHKDTNRFLINYTIQKIHDKFSHFYQFYQQIFTKNIYNCQFYINAHIAFAVLFFSSNKEKWKFEFLNIFLHFQCWVNCKVPISRIVIF